MRRSQTEIFGLAFIVILITMGIFFAIFFFVGREPAPSRGVESVLAANWLNTAMNTADDDCQGVILRELYQNCAQTNNLRCSTGQTACERAEEVSQTMLQGSFDQWGRKYHLTTGLDSIAVLGKPCPGARESKTQFVSVPGQQPLQVRLDLCG